MVRSCCCIVSEHKQQKHSRQFLGEKKKYTLFFFQGTQLPSYKIPFERQISYQYFKGHIKQPLNY